jgi:parvulin-like peptidyl-prolyl isomerase
MLVYPVAAPVAQNHEDVLVRVNKAAVTRRDLQIEIALLEAQIQQRYQTLSAEQLSALRSQLVENLIHRELLHQKAQEKKIKIQDRWVDKSLAGFKSKLGTKSAYSALLEKALINEAQFKSRIKKGLIVQRLLRREVLRRIRVSEAEMRAFYRKYPDFFIRREQVRLRQITIAVEASETASKRAEALLKIQTIQEQLRNGQNFAALALEYSEDGSRTHGGDLGYLERGQLIKPMADAAFSLESGQVSHIVESHLGFHLIQMVDRIPSTQMAYRNARAKIERTLRRDKENDASEKYLAKLMGQSVIQRLVRP